MAVKKIESAELTILPISEGEVTFAILGSSPLIFNRMSEKAKRELLLPKGRKTAADKAANLKHVPIEEYRASVYRNSGNTPPTRLKLPAPMFKGAISTAALDMPGTKKSEIGRATWVTRTHVDLYGVPRLLMSVVRSADMNRTPDIRTRAIVPEWACMVTIRFLRPKLTATGVANLMAAAGIIAGVGDFRQEKGKGSFGQFRLVEKDDPYFTRIVKAGARAAQDAALERPECYDEESAELLEWYQEEVVKRGRGETETPKRKGRNGAAEAVIQ